MKIKAQNFLSWKALEFEIGRGVTLIQGYNHDDGTQEGSGKSAILNALSWGAYGRIPKDANIDDVIMEGEKSCGVDIIHPEFTITRERGPNDLCIKYPSGKVYRGSTAVETQKEIVKLLGMSFETFCQSIYFAQNYPNKFVTANQEGKGKIITEILDLEQFDRARKIAGDRIKEKKEELSAAAKDHEKFASLVEWQRDDAKEKAMMIEQFQEEKVTKIKNLLAQISSLNTERDIFLQEFEGDKRAELKAKEREIEAVDAEVIANENELKELREALAEVDKDSLTLERMNRLKDQEEHEGLRDELKFEILGRTNEVQRQEQRSKDYKEFIKRTAGLNELIKGKKHDIMGAESDIEHYTETLNAAIEARDNPNKSSCPTCGQDWDGDPAHYQKEIAKAESDLKRGQKILKVYQSDLKGYQDGLKSFEASAKTLKTEIDAWKMPDLQKLERMLATENFGVEENRKRVKEIDDEMLAIEKLKLKEKSLTVRGQDLDKRRTRLAEEHSKISVRSSDKELEKFQARIIALEDAVVAEDAKEPEMLQTKHRDSKAKLKKLLGDRDAAGRKVSELEATILKLEANREGYREVKAYTFENTLNQLTKKTNRYLQELFNQSVKIKFKNVDLKIDASVKIDGTERAMGLYSGGQFRRIALAVDFALSDLVTSRRGNKLNFMALDEPFKDLSEEGMNRVLKILQNKKISILLIEHNSIFKSLISKTFEVELRDGISSIRES